MYGHNGSQQESSKHINPVVHVVRYTWQGDRHCQYQVHKLHHRKKQPWGIDGKPSLQVDDEVDQREGREWGMARGKRESRLLHKVAVGVSARDGVDVKVWLCAVELWPVWLADGYEVGPESPYRIFDHISEELGGGTPQQKGAKGGGPVYE